MSTIEAPEAPERIGPYRLLRRLGEGGMGVVHLGLNAEGREVAVKVLHPHVATDLKARDRLTREVETMRRVRSRRVAEVLDADLTGASPYIVTRYAPGRTLEQAVLEDGPLGDAGIVRLARGLCEALVSIHAADVIHRDLKPANVMLVDGEPLVIDFGIAHLVNATRLTQTGMFVGTPGYLAPEIIRDTEITQAADVHALAATVFYAATGQPPFGSGTFESVCYNVLEGKAQLDLAPAWLREWLRLALAKDAEARPAATSLLKLSRALDPSVTTFHENGARDGGTRLLDAATLHGDRAGSGPAAYDETAIIGEAAAPPGGDGRSDDYADLLPPVNYVEPERPRRDTRQRPVPDPGHDRVQPAYGRPGHGPATGYVQPAYGAPGYTQPGYAPPGYAPPGYAPGYGPPPAGYPPYPDQRVAGYPPSPQVAAPPTAPPMPPQAVARPTAPPAEAAPYGRDPSRPRYRAAHPILAGLLLVVLVALACLLPVTVSLFAVVAALCLRVGHHLLSDLAARRSIRGSSGADPFLAILGTPWALIKSTLATLVQVPLAAMFAMCVWGGLVYIGKMATDPAAAYAAGAFVAGLFVLPGGSAPRKAVSRALSSAIRSPGAGMVITITVGTVALFAVMTAISADASWAPWRPPSVAIDHVVADLRRRGEDTVVNLVGGLLGDIMDRIGLGFLTFWN
ncbi:serine/threonine-protein kinase [Sphaerimonospora sp. CA-214678]|uniref:serine/threonine-protein kinase n=1 Tax=Sphaerimonospora sp. CA-214678 TaxID=3240029 RepID=UPI003D907F77